MPLPLFLRMRLDARRNSSTRLLRSAFIRSSEEALIWFNAPVTYEACDYYAGGQLALRMTANEQVRVVAFVSAQPIKTFTTK